MTTTGSTTGSTVAGPTPAKASSQTTTAVAEPVKKKYPTVEEIEVIGGYQNLEKSCLVKNRGTPKRVSGNCAVFFVCLSHINVSKITDVLASYPYKQWLQRAEKKLSASHSSFYMSCGTKMAMKFSLISKEWRWTSGHHLVSPACWSLLVKQNPLSLREHPF